MPLEGSYAIWNNRGGSGKTNLTYHLAIKYAYRNPDKTVLVVDMCPQADLSHAFLGKFTSFLVDKPIAGRYSIWASVWEHKSGHILSLMKTKHPPAREICQHRLDNFLIKSCLFLQGEFLTPDDSDEHKSLALIGASAMQRERNSER